MSTIQPIGTLIQSRYRILGVLGRGGSGITYRAEDVSTGRQVALKELSLKGLSDWKKLELFEREAQVLADLTHPAIPRYVDYFQVDTTDNRLFYIAQNIAEGTSLADLVAAGARFTESDVKRIAMQVLAVLRYLHSLNPPIIHRDIKPQNIIRSPEGNIYLVDFGAVQLVHRETTAFGSTVVGTYGYMAPEQFRGHAHPTTDLYGLGATILYLLTHQNPGDLPQERLRINFRPYINVSEPFADWLDDLLEPLVEDRLSSAKAAIATLKNPIPYPTAARQSAASNRATSRQAAASQHPDFDSPEYVGKMAAEFLTGFLGVQPMLQQHPDGTWVVRKPSRTRVKLNRSDRRLSLHVPPGFRGPAINLAITAVLIMGGGCLMAGFALESSPFFGLLALLFWGIGGKYLWMFANETAGRFALEVRGDRYRLTRSLFGWKRQHQGSARDLRDVRMSYVYGDRKQQSVENIVLDMGSKSHKFGMTLSRLEKRWISSELQSFIHEIHQPQG